MKKIYSSIIYMLKTSIESHPVAQTDYEKGFIAGMREAIVQVDIAMKYKP